MKSITNPLAVVILLGANPLFFVGGIRGSSGGGEGYFGGGLVVGDRLGDSLGDGRGDGLGDGDGLAYILGYNDAGLGDTLDDKLLLKVGEALATVDMLCDGLM